MVQVPLQGVCTLELLDVPAAAGWRPHVCAGMQRHQHEGSIRKVIRDDLFKVDRLQNWLHVHAPCSFKVQQQQHSSLKAHTAIDHQHPGSKSAHYHRHHSGGNTLQRHQHAGSKSHGHTHLVTHCNGPGSKAHTATRIWRHPTAPRLQSAHGHFFLYLKQESQ